MANLTETAQWHDNIYQLALTDKVKGGVDGAANIQPKQLADRTKYLKAYAEEVAQARGDALTLSARLGELEELIEEGSDDTYEFFASFAELPNPGVNKTKCVTLDTGFTYVWEDTLYTARFASVLNFPTIGIVGVVYISRSTGLRYSWTGAAYAINFPTFGDFPTVGDAGVVYHAEDTGLNYTWHTDRYGEHYPTFSDFPIPGETGIYYIADDSGFLCSWDDASGEYTGTYSRYTDLPAEGIAGVLYYVTEDGLSYGWYTNRYEAHFATVNALPAIGIAGRYYVTDSDDQLYTWSVPSQAYMTTYAEYDALPSSGKTTILYIVTADNLTYVWNAAASRYETRAANFQALPETGIAGRNYVTQDTGRLFTWHTDKYGAHYAAYAAFPSSGTADRYWIDESSAYIYEWWAAEEKYAVHFPTFEDFPDPGIEGVIYVDDSTGNSYTYDGSEYAPTEGGNGVLGNGDNTTIEEVDLLTFMGFVVPQNATVTEEEAIIAEAVDELHARLNNGGSGNQYLGGMKLGFYLDPPRIGSINRDKTYQNTRIRISGFNHYKNAVNTRNHLVFEFKNIPFKKEMRSSNINDGGYPGTSGAVLKPYLEGDFLTALKAALGITGEKTDYIYNVTRNVTQGNYGSRTKTAFSAAIFPPTEKEVFGSNPYGDSTTEADLTQLPIYVQGQTKVKTFNGSAEIWWEGSPYASSGSHFCHVNSSGAANYNNAASSRGCAPLLILS
jgi:hypothetical protein